MLSCPATYCNVNGSVYSPASVRKVCRSACRPASAWKQTPSNSIGQPAPLEEVTGSSIMRRFVPAFQRCDLNLNGVRVVELCGVYQDYSKTAVRVAQVFAASFGSLRIVSGC